MPKKIFTDAVSAVLAGADPDQVADQVADKVLAEVAAPAEVQKPAEVKEPRVTIGAAVAELVMDATLSYDAIVHIIRERFADPQTSRRSIASVAARLRKDGQDVPRRRQQKGETA